MPFHPPSFQSRLPQSITEKTIMTEEETHLPCHSILEEILKDDEDVDDVKGDGKADLSDDFRNADKSSTSSSKDCVNGKDEPRQLANQRCCCGVKDRLDLENADFARDDFSGICVFTGGRFPCLHVRLANMEVERKYFVALDFTLINSCSGSVVEQGPIDYTEPYYIPRPNHLGGWGWMGEVMYFNINSIANGGLQENGMTLKMACEYEPTLRVLALSSDGAPYRAAAVRFQLKQTAFLVVSLHSEARESKSALVREFLLVRTSEMTRNRHQSECCRSPSLNGLDHNLASKFAQPFLQTCSFGDARRQQYQGDIRGQPCRPLRLSMNETAQLASSPLRLPAARLPFKETPANGGFVKPQHLFKPAGGIWPHHSCSNGTNGLAPGTGQAETPALATLFRSLQNCVPPRFVTDQKNRKVVLPNEARPSLPPFGRQQQNNVNPDWQQQRNSNILLRSNYDAFLGGYLQWVAKARNSVRQMEADQVKADCEVHSPQSPPHSPELVDPVDTAKAAGLQPGFPYQCGTYYYTPYWNTPVQTSPPVQFS